MTARRDGARRDGETGRGDGAPGMRIRTTAQCPECDRIFNLLDDDDAGEWFYGHDCEATA